MFEITFKKTAKRRMFMKSRFPAKTKIRSIYSQHWKYNLKVCSIDKIQWTSLLIGYCPSLNCTIKKKIPINKNLSFSIYINVMVNRYSEVILNIIEQVSRTIERVLESDIISHINIDCMQFDFMPVRSTDDAIFNLRQLYQAL